METVLRPTYRQLFEREGYPQGSSWGLWGDDDQIGALNLVTPEKVQAAARLVKRGAVFPLGWTLQLPKPPLFGRESIDHVKRDDGFGMDDHFNCFYPHASSHWDSLSHYRNPVHGYYGGRTAAEMKGEGAKNSIAEWARVGVATRFVLVDVERWRAKQERPIVQGTADAISLADVIATLAEQRTEVEEGDILLFRFGWVDWYEGLDAPGREALAEKVWDFAAPGLEPSEEILEWLWDNGVVAAGSDVPALEVLPYDPHGNPLHARLLALLGINIGEMFALDALAEDCAQDGVYEGFLTAAPLNYHGATGSPANALAFK